MSNQPTPYSPSRCSLFLTLPRLVSSRRTGATWGLQRISAAPALPAGSDPTALAFTYRFNPAAGAGVDVYVVDTGVLTTHEEFGGRARMVYATPGLNNTDDNGHGSHVAGTVGGATFGVGKLGCLFTWRRLVEVRDTYEYVFGLPSLSQKCQHPWCQSHRSRWSVSPSRTNQSIRSLTLSFVRIKKGSGSTSDIIAGLDFAVTAAQASGRPSVITMSIGGAKTASLDDAATAAISAGIHVIAAAGNDSEDVINDSPASAPGVIAVGSMNINDEISSFSNFGYVRLDCMAFRALPSVMDESRTDQGFSRCYCRSDVAIFAPGEQVVSCGISSNTATAVLSGTSQATPHIAGIVALLLSEANNLTPTQISGLIKQLAVSNDLTALPSGTSNLVAQNFVANTTIPQFKQ